MKFSLNLLRFRKPRNQNSNDNACNSELIVDNDGIRTVETKLELAEENSCSAGERKSVTDEEVEAIDKNTDDNSTTSSTLVVSRERSRAMDSPPVDDCCPICFGNFVVPCRAPCAHWFCGGCILQYWNYGASLQPCKCPMCSQQITRLTPEVSLYNLRELEVTGVLENVKKYNRLFVGGPYGLILKVLELPFFIKRMLRGMMDPDRAIEYLYKLRLFAIFLGVLYTFSPFDFLPIDHVGAVDLFDYSAIALSFILNLVGIYVQRRRSQDARRLAAAIQP